MIYMDIEFTYFELKESSNSMTIFDNRFEDISYCWKIEKVLWLSLIIIKKEHRNKGM